MTTTMIQPFYTGTTFASTTWLLLQGVGVAGARSEPVSKEPPQGRQEPESLRARLLEAVREIQASTGERFESYDGNALDCSARWIRPLRARGIPAVLALTDSSRGESVVGMRDGTRRLVSRFHAFVVIFDGCCELIVDPTWKQFVADKSLSLRFPSVLVGTRQELLEVYESLASELQLETTCVDPLRGEYEPASVVDLLYSTGANQHLRQMLD